MILKVGMKRNGLFISAFFYLMAFVWMDILYWLMVPSLVLLCCALFSAPTWRQGWWWGVLVYGGHLGLLFYGLMMLCWRPLLIAGWLAMTTYCAAHSALLFAFCAGMRSRVPSRLIRIIAILGLLSGMIWWIDRKILWIFGVEGGYCLVNPLLPLIYGRLELLRTAPLLLEQLGVVRLGVQPCQSVDEMQLVMALFAAVARERERKPAMACVVSPESLLPFALHKNVLAMNIISDNSYVTPLLLGGFFDCVSHVQNGHYWFENGALRAFFGKQHLMPFVEKMPRGWDWPCLRSLFLGNNMACCEDATARAAIELVPGLRFYPIICSELFCGGKLLDLPEDCIALVMVNDAWLGSSVLMRCAALYAVLQAAWHDAAMLYISSRYTLYIGRPCVHNYRFAVYSEKT